ncbi:MAG: aminoacyl-tRNA hydrolase [Lachnospiraceae bacterium]|nr:aminoacyl-tRNA hydrolase [Lachnospiraceae bacterium]MBQ1516570.1 aminoacyl-tRNA hydrolase [Lachnospiraceae bacterium]MBQ3400689.1 aminoacyl-tRNA hydrolase [Lachnospiraceae bacterium]MBQ4308425.1 aminoacyl-tRNA hydrolase [Lachnospiraceae bacterium]MBQ9463872.1 aminoacyl-tRNA hydrolase [Lachnospiraceae bacterium]
MYLIAGLGNPGREYAGSRHNAGFSLIYELAKRCGVKPIAKEHQALTALGRIGGQDVILAMPQTYMNLSGNSVRRLAEAYRIDVATELIVAYDDINLDLGRLRVRTHGSAGGHNGMKNIIECLGTDGFTRIRIGVGNKPGGLDLKDFVLGSFDTDEQEIIRESVELAADAVETIITAGPEAAMNRYNPYHKGAEEDAQEKKERRESFEAELMAARQAADEAVSEHEDGFTDPEEFSGPYRYRAPEDLNYRDESPSDET